MGQRTSGIPADCGCLGIANDVNLHPIRAFFAVMGARESGDQVCSNREGFKSYGRLISAVGELYFLCFTEFESDWRDIRQ